MNKIAQLILLLIPFFSFSQTDTVAHLYTFGGNNNDNAEEIEATTDGGYIVVGSTSSNSSGNTDIYLLKVDSMCNYQWSQAIGGTNNDWGYSIKQTFDKGFIIAASSNSYGNGGYDAVLMKRDSLGNYVWKKTYGGNDWDFAYSVVQTYDSGFVFCGETYNNTNGYSDVYIVKTNPFGDTLWTKTFGGALIDKGNSVIETSDSNIVVAGIINTTSDSTQIYIIKLTSTGTLLWDSIYGGVRYENANQIIETSDGDYVVIGGTSSVDPGIDESIYLFKINTNGNFLWQQTFGYDPFTPGKNDEGVSIKEMSNGDLLLLSNAEKHGGGLHDISLIRVNSGGWWLGIAITIGSSNEEIPNRLTNGTNGNILIAGKIITQSNEDILLIRLDTVYAGMDTSMISYNDFIPLNLNDIDDNIFNKVIFPNPVIDKFQIDMEVNLIHNYQIVIYDNYGRVVFQTEFIGTEISVNQLSSGLYILSLIRNDEIIFKKKFIKQ